MHKFYYLYHFFCPLEMLHRVYSLLEAPATAPGFRLQKVNSPSGHFQSIHWENVITSYLLKLSIPACSHYGIKVKRSAFNTMNAETRG